MSCKDTNSCADRFLGKFLQLPLPAKLSSQLIAVSEHLPCCQFGLSTFLLISVLFQSDSFLWLLPHAQHTALHHA